MNYCTGFHCKADAICNPSAANWMCLLLFIKPLNTPKKEKLNGSFILQKLFPCKSEQRPKSTTLIREGTELG